MKQADETVVAVLGPTNTGKTHYAIERMLAHRSGVIGLPLRLLAREVYDRCVALRGPSVVALVTGEERIVPPRAQYWIATVEAMPTGIGAEFVAIDEIQLCADPERGHVFTERLLHMRGTRETLFLGSDSMRGVINTLVSNVRFMHRDRFSELLYAGPQKISRLRARTAIVGFSVDNVYAIAELLRRRKGGAAVVMGALSPRTRNAQVDLYQNGDVDHLVATDAIGMGLNLDIDHVAFSSLSKFDGRRTRALQPNEIAQIAGRAGRYQSSGTFGVTADAPPLGAETIEAVENHRFTPLKKIQWRNSALDFGSARALIASLEKTSTHEILMRAREASDLAALRTLADTAEIAALLTTPRDVKLLWEICRVPDFRNISHGEHTSLLSQLMEFLHRGGTIPDDWLDKQIKRISRTDGDIDTLAKRLAFIRTWTYVSQRKNWVEDEKHWQGVSRQVEDRLSDALHERLTQRFVDRRTSILMRRLKDKEALVAQVNDKGEVTVEDQFVGRLIGFRFQQDKAATADEAKTLRAAGLAALAPEFNLRSDRFYNAPDTEIDFTEQGGLMWGENAVGKLVAGPDALTPGIEVFVDDEAGADVAEKVRRRLGHFVERRIAALFEPLMALKSDETLTGMAKGVAFRIVEGLGILPRSEIAQDIKDLDQDARGLLRKHGVRFGQYTLFQPLLLKPAPTRLRLVLWSLAEGLEVFPESPPPGLVTVPASPDAPAGYFEKSGYRQAGSRAIRIDMLERLADMTRACDSRAGFEATADMLSITGMTLEQFADLMCGLGYRAEKGEREKKKPQTPAAPTEKTEAAAPPEGAEAEAEADTAAPLASDAEIATPDADAAPATPPNEVDAAQEAPETETYYVFTWKPARKPADAGKRQKPQGKKPKRDKARSAGKSAASAARKEKPIDPDNPFAALMALKTGK